MAPTAHLIPQQERLVSFGAECRIDWQFTTQDARIKLKRRYPSIELG